MTACSVTWTEADDQLPHDVHACVFVTLNAHTRHECTCGLSIVWALT